ncbi:MAG TPA: tRNA-dihydrouridine synthase family protein, partial [Kofleriaceae bacterium]|nr:tRNA-dihydrouridine synthase family protein [Kofleriaceae bacterium]
LADSRDNARSPPRMTGAARAARPARASACYDAGVNAVGDLLARFPVVLAPMEDVSDAGFRAVCRGLGAELCVTELIRAEQVIARADLARRKAALPDGDRPTAIQIYGGDARLLMQAARVAALARPAFVDLNCGCWIPRIARGGAGAGWLRDPAAMVAMAREVVAAVAPLGLPVTVKTRIGFGPESEMPIVDLARRLEDAGVAALAIHCRTAQAGHAGRTAVPADWRWARRAREVVSIPVIVNGDIASAADVVRALAETGCAGVMIGRAAIQHPWIFAEAKAALAGTPAPAPPDDAERLRVFRLLLDAAVAARGERHGVQVVRRHLPLLGPRLGPALRDRLFAAATLPATLDLLAAA